MLKPRGEERCSLFADLYTLHITEVENIGSFYFKKKGKPVTVHVTMAYRRVEVTNS
jgi:hypothetical protein